MGGNGQATVRHLFYWQFYFLLLRFFACQVELFQFDASACGKLLLTAFVAEWHKLIRKSNEATTAMMTMVKVTRPLWLHPCTSWGGPAQACFPKISQILDFKKPVAKIFFIIVCFLIEFQLEGGNRLAVLVDKLKSYRVAQI